MCSDYYYWMIYLKSAYDRMIFYRCHLVKNSETFQQHRPKSGKPISFAVRCENNNKNKSNNNDNNFYHNV